MLQAWREARDMTQTTLATLVGVSQATLSDWEKGKKLPKIPAAVKLAQVTANGVPVEAWAPEQAKKRASGRRRAA